MHVGWTAIATCAALVIAAAICDIASRHIPNWLTLGALLLGLGLHTAVGIVDGGFAGAARGAAQSAAGVLVCGLVPVISFARNQMGGGDVKLFAAIGALCGPALGFDVEAFTFLVLMGAVLPWRLVRNGALAASFKNGATMVRNAFLPADRRLPYAEVKLPPVIMAPAVVVGLAIALLTRGMVP